MESAVAAPPEMLPLEIGERPAPPPRRPRVLLIGTALASTAVVAAFAAVFGAYVSVRSQVVATGEPWLPSSVEIPLSPGNMAMVTLVMSLVGVQWAVHAARHRDRPHTYLALGLTILLGLAHIVQIAFLWTEWGVVLNGGEATTAGVLLFTVIGMQVAMTAGGLIFLGLMTVRSLGGQLTGSDSEGISAAALFWWVTVALYTVFWYSILITK